MRVAVTGASGTLGRVVAAHLADSGHEVLRIDVVGERAPDFVRVDLTDGGAVLDVLAGADEHHAGLDAVVHLGAIPAPGLVPDLATFHNNLPATYHVLQGARRAGIRRVVFASSETVLGLPFDAPPPYAPVDERYPTRPELASKLVRWDDALSITAMRFSNVMVPEDYARFEGWQDDPAQRKWNLWGYIDARDGAQAVRLALEAGRPGFDRFIVAAADTVMRRDSADLLAEFFPGVERTRDIRGRETLLGIDHAREVLGYSPEHSWLDGA
jgi:nucleoside-diphosphate-sugar epimerase